MMPATWRKRRHGELAIDGVARCVCARWGAFLTRCGMAAPRVDSARMLVGASWTHPAVLWQSVCADSGWVARPARRLDVADLRVGWIVTRSAGELERGREDAFELQRRGIQRLHPAVLGRDPGGDFQSRPGDRPF